MVPALSLGGVAKLKQFWGKQAGGALGSHRRPQAVHPGWGGGSTGSVCPGAEQASWPFWGRPPRGEATWRACQGEGSFPKNLWAEPPTHTGPKKGAPSQAALLGCSYKAPFMGSQGWQGSSPSPAQALPLPRQSLVP